MKLTPVLENEAARRLLEIVPPTFRAEVSKTLRLIQFSSYLAGLMDRQEEELPKKNNVIPILTDREP